MTEHTIKKLELEKVIEQVLPFSETSLAKELLKKLKPLTDLAMIERIQEEVDQASQLLQIEGQIPLGGINDLYPALKKAEKGIVLTAQDFLDVQSTIYGAKRVKNFFTKLVDKKEQFPLLWEIADNIQSFRELEEAIGRVFDDRGEVKDSATPKLQSIRREQNLVSARVRTKLEQIISSSRYEKIIQENVITSRGGRYVVPIKSDQKTFFPGIIHDRSASGQTVFVEPQAVVEANNRLRILEQDEKDELHKIFKGLTSLVLEKLFDLRTTLEALSYLDFTMAKARYGLEKNCSKPILNSNGPIVLYQARHPLLKGEVVPIDIILGTNYNTLVITGPNTGGKTVTLKTAGLLSLMAQCGLAIPAKDGSEVGIFKGIYVDVGDEQSIEQSLSTFSSHMAQIVRILGQVEPGDLVLLDEVGAGTDPEEGAALAMAILNYLHQKKALTIATTHYSELKAYAYSKEGLENASVEFNVETLSPTYRLLIGVPGRSNAFAIASRLGLKDEIIESAQALVKQDRTNLEHLISRIESEEYALLDEKESLQEERDELATLKNRLIQEREKENARLEELKAQLYRESRDLISSIKEEGNLLLKKIRGFGGPAADRLANEFNLALQDKEKALANLRGDYQEQETHPGPSRELKKGDTVLVIDLKQKGRITSLGQNQFQVQIGMMNIWVDKNNLVLTTDKEEVRGGKRVAKLQGMKAQTISTRLDLRGARWEDARERADKYLDDAYLAGLKRVEIIHGKGTGALREGIHDLLKDHYHVKDFRLGEMGEGGSGVTIVNFA